MTASQPLPPIFQGLAGTNAHDGAGNLLTVGAPLVGGKLYTYDIGTTTPKTTYSDAAGAVPNTNPVILDGAGQARVRLGTGGYKFVLKDATDVTQWTEDAIYSVPVELSASGGSALVGFIQAGIGAVARTAQAKMRDTVSVKDFGAIGDGVTNDRAAFQAAIDYIQGLTNGGRVIVPGSATYLLDSAIVVALTKSIIIEGDGDGAKLRLNTGAGGPILNVTGGSPGTTRQVIRDLFLQGPVSGTSNGIRLNNANNCRIENCVIQSQVTGIDMNSSFAVEMIGNTFDVCTTYGVFCGTAAHNLMLERNGFFTCGVSGGGQAIRLDVASDNIGIKDNDFEFCNVNVRINNCSSVEITGNYMEYHKSACFDFQGTNYGVSIESNWIALGDSVGGGSSQTITNINGGRFVHNTIFDQSVSFTASGLVGFEVGLNKKTGTGTVGGTPWIAPTLLNSWAQQANYTTVGYIKDQFGWVHLRGALVSGTAPNILFTLPSGYRPANIAVFGNDSASGPGRITVKINGDVEPTVAASNNSCLDGISFYVGV